MNLCFQLNRESRKGMDIRETLGVTLRLKVPALLLVLLLHPPILRAQVVEFYPDILNQPVDPAIMETVNSQLSESTNVDAAYLNTDFDPYLPLNQEATVSVTFLDEGAGYRNSLGYFTFQEFSFDGLSKGDIDGDGSGTVSLNELGAVNGVAWNWVFPNASEAGGGGSLVAGDTVQLNMGNPLEAGTRVSFFLAQNAWEGGDVSSEVLDGDTQIMYGLDFLNPEADFTSTVDSNLADARHVAMLFADESKQQVIMGFEDLNRIDRYANDYNYRSDEDFNDAVFLVSADPADAFGESNIATAPIPPLGKGLFGLLLVGVLARLSFPRSRTGDRSNRA